MKSPTVHRWSCFDSSAWPTLKSEIVIQTDVNFDMETDLPKNSVPMKSSQLWSPDDANLYNVGIFLYNVGIFLDLVRSEGLRWWNMALHEEYHYELFNRLPGYCGRYLQDTEDTDGFNPDVRETMDFANYAHSRPVGGETRGVDTIDTVFLCRTMSDNEFENQDV